MTLDIAPAYALWVELSTRVAMDSLHYRMGDEETAAQSIHSLFRKTRDLLEKNPEARLFRPIALKMLNTVLRPYTARWNGWMAEDKSRLDSDGQATLVFRDELVRRMFRAELRQLQPQLFEYRAQLAMLAGVADEQATAQGPTASLGGAVKAGIGKQVDFTAGPKPSSKPIHDRINAAEHAEILERRRILAKAKAPDAVLTNAAGLALSGGGIRSATYCLGIVQVLVRQGLFAEFDYLSTVSGGGYFGTFLSSALGTNPPTKKSSADSHPPPGPSRESVLSRIDDVFHRQGAGTESGLIRHLRNNSKYLLHGGAVAKLRIVGLLVSGILWNMLMVLPIALGLTLLAYALASWFNFWGDALTLERSPPPTIWPVESSASATWLALSVWFAAAALLFLPLVQKIAHGDEPKSRTVAFRRLYIATAIALGVNLVAAFILYVQPALFHFYEKLRLALANFGTLFGKISDWAAPAVAGSGSVLLGIIATSAKSNWPRLKSFAAQLFILSGPVFFLILYLMVGNHLGLGRTTPPPWNAWFILILAAGLTLWSALVVNINTLAPHVYYRARLCECYLTRRLPKPPTQDAAAQHPSRTPMRRWFTGEFSQNRTEALQQVRLTDLGADPAAPYHLINTTLNVPGSDNKELRGRNGDFFLVSKHFCGAPIVGYVPTPVVQKADPHFDLGTAMAVSGAAASTSMGWKSLPNLRFLLTMLNVRLGYWLPWRDSMMGPGVWYFCREMLASMNERCRYLNLSDGGHIENLGAYELLRRRCKFIVCVDGGQEPGMECADLSRLQRYAEIDFGIEFEYGIADLSIQPNGFSRASAILVKITYPETSDGQPEALGWMLYLKLALIGIEPVYVLDYRRENPAFPHETTGDQIYEEAQFEAYRRLGECAAENLFRDEIIGKKKITSVHQWFQQLANNLLADNDPVFSTPQQSMAAAGAPVAPAPEVKPPPT